MCRCGFVGVCGGMYVGVYVCVGVCRFVCVYRCRAMGWMWCGVLCISVGVKFCV